MDTVYTVYKKKPSPQEYMPRYKNWSPTGFDPNGLLGEEHDISEHWVLPCMRTRDSGVYDESNFETALEELGGESEDVEVHRFGHWGPGWFEIILVRPGTEAEKKAVELCVGLENYPLVDEDDFFRREHEAVDEYWEQMGMRDRIHYLQKCELSIFAARSESFPHEIDDNGRLYEELRTD